MEENAKLRNAAKSKENRTFGHNQSDTQGKKNSKIQGLTKNDIAQLVPPQSTKTNSPIKKIFKEANKVVSIGMEKDFAIREKDTMLQTLTGTADNLRKNIIHLQMEYEKLDQNYQREISYRTEVVKRMESTREMVESAVYYSNALSTSLKQLEEDKLKIVEFYYVINQGQKEIEEKHLKLEKIIKEKDNILKTKIDDVKKSQDKIYSQNSETILQLNKKLCHVSDKLKTASTENDKFQSEISELKHTITDLKISIDDQKTLNNLQKNDLDKSTAILKKFRRQKLKYKKLMKSKQREAINIKTKYKYLLATHKSVQEKCKESLSTIKFLEEKNNQIENILTEEIENSKIHKLKSESEKEELINGLLKKDADLNELKSIIDEKNERIKKLIKKKEELESVKIQFNRLNEENVKLKEMEDKLNQENINKDQIIWSLKEKEKDFTSRMKNETEILQKECNKYKALVKQLEVQLVDTKNMLSEERSLKEKLKSEFDEIFQQIKIDEAKIDEMQHLIDEKIKIINDLTVEVNDKTRSTQILKNEMCDKENELKEFAEKLEAEFQEQKLKSEELSRTVENLTKTNKNLTQKIDEAELQISDFRQKLNEEKSINKNLENKLMKAAMDTKKEVELEKKSSEHIRQKLKNTETELIKMQNIMSENSELNENIFNLRQSLVESEARVEAYKVVVKKLENEKNLVNKEHEEEISKLKSEVARLKLITENNRSQKFDECSPKTTDIKENDMEVTEINKTRRGSITPIQGSKNFLSTPRKIFTSTPQPGIQRVPPKKSKIDPYEFDSDNSVERLNPDRVLKTFNNRTKREQNKISKVFKN